MSRHHEMVIDKLSNGLPPDLSKQVSRGAQIIQCGGIVAYPTDTVYGLGASIYKEGAIQRLFSVKSRPLTMPMPVLIAEREDVELLTAEESNEAIKLMDKFWPSFSKK